MVALIPPVPYDKCLREKLNIIPGDGATATFLPQFTVKPNENNETAVHVFDDHLFISEWEGNA